MMTKRWVQAIVAAFLLLGGIAGADELVELQSRASSGDAKAQARLGALFATGKWVPQDYVEAAKWYRKAAELGDASSQFLLGTMYVQGRGVLKNHAEGVKWARKAAKQGHPGAQAAVGVEGTEKGPEPPPPPSGSWESSLRARAEKGSPQAQYSLALHLIGGEGVDRNCGEAEEWLRMAAKRGHVWAQEGLGSLYSLGCEGVQDYVEGAKWYRKAAEQGSASAQLSLGNMYAQGRGIPRNYIEAVVWWQKAANQGHAGAQNNLGLMYSQGWGVQKNHGEAVKWYRMAAEHGHSGAQDNLGDMYSAGRGVPKSKTDAAKWHRKASAQVSEVPGGDPQMPEEAYPLALDQFYQLYYSRATVLADASDQFALGKGYEYDLADYAEAVKWYRRAAEQGFLPAQKHVALIYSLGDGVPQDYSEAVKWYRKAAEQGDADAQASLGYAYYRGRGVAKDYSEALKWYRKASEQGNATAESRLGSAYAFGRGVSQDYAEAMKWYLQAAEQGYDLAQYFLGTGYEEGKGVPQDYAEAVKWYGKAAEHGETAAQQRLGFAYERGRGVPKDYVQAHKWYNLAAGGADEEDRDMYAAARDSLASKMTPAQLAEAQRLAREWKPRTAGSDEGLRPTVETKDAAFAVPDEYDRAAEELEAERAAGTSTDVDRDIPEGAARNPDAVAVVIGIKSYRSPDVPPVDFADWDATVVKEYLVRTLGYQTDNIVVVADATLSEFLQLFGSKDSPKGKLYNWVKPGKSDVLIYYAGHGTPDLKGQGAYFVPSDANRDYIVSSGYPLSLFWENLAKVPARTLTVVLDTCFSGNVEGGKILVAGASPLLLTPAAQLKGPEGAVVMTSATADQVSGWYPEKSHSLFTYFWLRGLGGEADANKDGAVTVGELGAYVKENVPSVSRRLRGREQTPTVTGAADRVLATLK